MSEQPAELERRKRDPWKRWGPYLSERQWGTVREDYSPLGSCWEYLTHDQARSRAYRWGEDGLLGLTDRQCRVCVGPALWNGNDPILKERLFGLTGPQGNHGEDVKECYYYLDNTPSHSYMRALYKYPQASFPYEWLVEENQRRGKEEAEFELTDTGIFDDHRYFDVFVEYAKAAPDDVLIRFQIHNRGPDPSSIHLLPTVWYRNTWSWGVEGRHYWEKSNMHLQEGSVVVDHPGLPEYRFDLDGESAESGAEWLFTDNETNHRRLFHGENRSPYVKDAFHRYVIHGETDAVNPDRVGTKVARHLQYEVPAGGHVECKARLTASGSASGNRFDSTFDRVFEQRKQEADAFYDRVIPDSISGEDNAISRGAYAGLLWTKQFYFYDVSRWRQGDPAQPEPPEGHKTSRNTDWDHMVNQDVISMPDKWEYPWYAVWDLAFHAVSFSRIDPEFAKGQLELFLQENYMHPNGALPAYEFAFSDVNPPVHAWAVWRVYKMAPDEGKRDREFLARCFHKLTLNFTWWVNQKDRDGNNVFGGGFLGLDNIGLFDRSLKFPGGGHLEQADGTAWMAFYCSTLMQMALELAREDPSYESMAIKFFEHFVAIADSINHLNGTGLWDEEDGFYYDQIHSDDGFEPVKVRSLVGLIPLLATEPVPEEVLEKLPRFQARCEWYLENRPDVMRLITCDRSPADQCMPDRDLRLLALPSRERLESILEYLLDPGEFLSEHGIRSVSKHYEDNPYGCHLPGVDEPIDYQPAESRSNMFGGNSNWRGPIWFPINYLVIEALERYHYYYGDRLQVEYPRGSGNTATLNEVAVDLSDRLASLFRTDEGGNRPCHGDDPRYAEDPHWRDYVLFYEYFHGDTGRGCGASHQTGWTALVAQCLETVASGDRD